MGTMVLPRNMAHRILVTTLMVVVAIEVRAVELTDVLAAEPALDSAIPTPEQVVGLGVGQRHWFHHEIVHYLDALAAASSRMQPLGVHAQSYGGRALGSYAISSERNLARLDEIKAARAAIVDPGSTIDLGDQPAVLHMMYSIHGNEPSGANATPLLSYYLAAAQDPAIVAQLDKVVIILNPILNPDGLDRFAAWTNNHRGLTPSADPLDREHAEAAPNGRTNYYWFDLNRDWLPHQHPESQGRVALFHEWKPNVQLDFHEQGSNNSYFFMPGKAERTYPLTPSINQTLTAKISEFHSKVFDRDGVLYFTREGYDDFYVGKGSTYPDLFGCVGILFEQPSSRGAKQDTINGLLTFENAIVNQLRASLSSIEGTAALKDELLAYQRSFYTEQIKKQRRGHYLAKAEGDKTRLREFVRILQGHQIKVEGITRDITVDGTRYPAGETIAIALDQPNATYLRAMWQRQVTFTENVFYDVSTWTMPLAFALDHTPDPVRGASTAPLPQDFLVQSAPLAESSIGYLVDWRDSGSPELLYGLLEAKANVRVATRPLAAETVSSGQITFDYGTLFVAPALGQEIPSRALALLRQASLSGAPIYAAASSNTPSGIDLGSRDFKVLTLPKVLLVSGPNTSSYQVGEIWHLLDRRAKMPVTMVDTYRLSSVNLDRYSHVILTSALGKLPKSIPKKLNDFVGGGGVVWAQGAAALGWLKDQQLIDILWRQTKAEQATAKIDQQRTVSDAASDELEALLPARRPFAAAKDEAAFKLVRGAILDGMIDRTHPMGFGYTNQTLPTFRRDAKFMARSENAYSTPILYTDTPLLSGYMSEENQQLARGSAGLIVQQQGRGAFVLSLDIPAFRAFWWGTQRLLLNAIFFGELLEEPG